ncbi:MAG: SRPBCC family protein [Actinobacteria bacterium]|nr:MAG: SRPBCC family protein [Actinomycetota bacterium]
MTMPAAPDAILQDQEGRTVLRFERTLRHSPERVWRALTEPAEHRSWHPTPFELDPVVGGRVTYLAGGDAPAMPAGEVTEYDPPHLLAHTWDDDLLRWEVRAHDDGCVVVLTHTFDDHFKAARDAAGWHVCLDALSATLDGAQPPHGEDGERLPSGWRELNTAYEQRFGIPPEKATPPPKP